MKTLVIATRGSKLALWQANHVKSLLASRYPDLAVELCVIKTKGDIILDVPLAKIGGKGLFVKEIEEALLDGRAHLAVHSMKDVPMELPEGLVLGVIPQRAALSDLFLSTKYASLMDLPDKAILGTSSLRRQAQCLALRPDLDVRSLRGNVETRLRKMVEGEFDAIILAKAGMERLGLTAPIMHEMGPPLFLPACGQGAIGLEYRNDDTNLHEMLAFMNHDPTNICVTAERAFLTGLEGGCQVPIAGHAILDGDTLHVTGLVASPDGKTIIRKSVTGAASEAKTLGAALANTIKESGGKAILDELYHEQ